MDVLSLLKRLGIFPNAQTVTTTPITAATDMQYLVDATGGARVINLPPAATVPGRAYMIKKTDASANTVTVDPDGAETINGASTMVLSYQNTAIIAVSDGASWHVC